jgi:hypothetical protein
LANIFQKDDLAKKGFLDDIIARAALEPSAKPWRSQTRRPSMFQQTGAANAP